MIYLRKLRAMVALLISSIVLSTMALADDVITFAEADTITGESLINLIAFERAKARGVKAEAISLQSDDLVHVGKLNVIKNKINNSLSKKAYDPQTVGVVSSEGEGILKEMANEINKNLNTINDVRNEVPIVALSEDLTKMTDVIQHSIDWYQNNFNKTIDNFLLLPIKT